MQQVLIPLKRLAQAKSRLAHVLTPAQRRALVLSMVRHVATVVRSACAADTVISLVSNEPTAPQLAEELGLRLIDDCSGELNGALTAARQQIARDGAQQLVIVAADLPQLTAEDVQSLFAGLSAADVVIGPDRNGLGTNALALRLPQGLALPLCYGAVSAAPHAAAAHVAGLSVAWQRSATLGLDVDDAEALAELALLGG